ncbi:MAG: transcriptional regulator [Candidatus Methylomirabilis sp.]|nr:transcriptional regulator [Deltaproteobacteria bacterium]
MAQAETIPTAPADDGAAEPRVIKRYGNRKLYDTLQSRYVTLDEIAGMIRGGEDVKVLDNKTKEDLTSVTLTQIILEEEKHKRPILPLRVLKDLIQQGSDSIAEAVETSKDRIAGAREEVEKRVQHLIHRGELTRDEAEKAIKDVLNLPAKGIEGLQKRIDETVDGIFNSRKMREEIRRLEAKIEELEAKLGDGAERN